MHSQPSSNRLYLMAALGLASVLFPTLLLHADFIFLKDGFTLQGDILKEGENYRDPASGQQLWMPKLGGFYTVNDYARRVVFSQRYVAEARKDEAERTLEVFHINQPSPHPDSPALSTIFGHEVLADWDPKGWRRLRVMAGEGKFTVDQGITGISPHFIRAGGQRQHWTCSFLTREFEPAYILRLIRDRKKKGVLSPAEEQWRIFRFCVQAGWHDEAAKELAEIEQKFPAEKEKAATARKDLRRLQAERWADEVDIAVRAGQSEKTQAMIAAFAEEGAPDPIIHKLRGLQVQHQELAAKLRDMRRLLAASAMAVKDLTLPAEFLEALEEMTGGLSPDTCGRLDAFLPLARQEERNQKQNKEPALKPEQLLALAVSGWAAGSKGAESNVDSTLQLWRARQFLLRYLRTHDADDRKQLLPPGVDKGGTEGQPALPPIDVIAQLIEYLPPAFVEKEPPKEPAEMSTITVGDEKSVSYRLQLPPDYRHQRAWPVLIVLHNAGVEPQHAMNVWSNLAARHGYILVGPKWSDAFADSYKGSDEERGVVPKVLRDLKRRFNVDSERVFMFGFANAGVMAYDIGLLYPDLFAGVAVMCGRPRTGPAFRHNAQLLPFYVVDGELNGRGPLETRELFKEWVPRGYPSLYVEYTGRGYDFFPAELPYIFDWMSRKKRRLASELGKPDPLGAALGQDFAFRRNAYTRFYWLSSEGSGKDARLTGRIAGNNQIVISCSGLRQISVWLNSAMVDLEQPLDININSRSQRFKKIVKPSLETLLEDFYARGDKRNLFTAKVDFKW